jgi:hypothetical protein
MTTFCIAFLSFSGLEKIKLAALFPYGEKQDGDFYIVVKNKRILCFLLLFLSYVEGKESKTTLIGTLLLKYELTF